MSIKRASEYPPNTPPQVLIKPDKSRLAILAPCLGLTSKLSAQVQPDQSEPVLNDRPPSNGSSDAPASSRDSASFIVRVRRERTRLDGPAQGYRLEIEDVQNGERKIFAAFDALVSDLRQRLGPYFPATASNPHREGEP